jgi:type VI secretion system secreted protein VgrG
MNELFTLTSEAVPKSTKVLAVHGTEAFSQPYSFELSLHLPSEVELDLAGAVGKRATITFHEADGTEESTVHGLFAAVELLEALPSDTLYRAVLVPKLWWLGQNRHSRVFVKEKLPAIIEKVLTKAGWSAEDYRLVLRARGSADAYPTLEHVCQYRESDLSFLSRWMEREGMYYYFEESAEKEKLVITDVAQAHKGLDGGRKRYFPRQGSDASPVEAFRTLRCTHHAQPVGVRCADYNYLHPDLPVNHEEKTADGPLLSLFGENVSTPEEAKWLAQVRTQELKTAQVVYRGEGRVYGLRPGYRFTLKDHPRIAEELLVTEVTHRGGQLEGAGELRESVEVEWEGKEDGDYGVEVVAIPASVQYRAPRVSPTPRITGLESAVVDGEVTDRYAQLDEHGQYLVRIKFDESEAGDGKASMRMRMLQPHGGDRQGMHFPLKKGTEVMVAFLGGDPDRPVIVGAVHNAHTPSMVTSLNPTQNVLLTAGQNRVVMEDLDAKQYFRVSSPTQHTFLHLGAPRVGPPEFPEPEGATEHNLVLSTDGNGLIHTGTDRNITVDGNQTEKIKQDLTETYSGNHATHVLKKRHETVDDHVTQTFNKGLTLKVTAEGVVREVTGGETETIKGGRSQKIEGASTEKITGALVQTLVGGAAISTPQRYEIAATGEIVLTSGQRVRTISPETVEMQFAKYVKMTPVFLDLIGAKFGVYGAATSVYGMKADLVGLKVDEAKVVIKNNPISVTQAVHEVKCAALGAYMYALVMIG